MHALLIPGGSVMSTSPLTNARLSSAAGYDEAWLQQLLFEYPDLLPLDIVDPGAGQFIPICRELPMPKIGGSVFLDLFGITVAGRPVLVECKLWRNPQARREVVGQLLEYAALLKRWSYGDLTARLKARLNMDSANPLFDLVAQHRADLDEARFVDSVSGCLADGDFDLIVAGDGIRSDMHAIASFLGAAGGLMARFALIEFQVWRDHAGTTVVLPSIPCRTEVIEHRVLVGADGRPLTVGPAEDERAQELPDHDPDKEKKRLADRAFWEKLIATIRFSHPDQPPPRHGGRNWVRVPLPEPCRMTLYRTADEVGAFVDLIGDAQGDAFERLQEDRDVLESEIGEKLTFRRPPESPRFRISTGRAINTKDPATIESQASWLHRVGDRFVTALRTRL